MDINNKNIILTGAASGIGAALLDQLLEIPGVQIVATDLNAISHKPIPGQLHLHQGDIATEQGIEDLFEFAQGAIGNIDIFIANAGFAYYEKNHQEDWQHVDRIYRCNTFSPIYCAHKLARINENREYCILITASFMGLYSLPGYSLYSSTKSALLSWADAYNMEKTDKGHVLMLCPVATKTHFFDTTAPVPWPTQTADEVAKAAIKGIKANKTRIYPSKLSQLTLFLNWVFPLTMPIYRGIEKLKFKQWLNAKPAEQHR